MKLLGEAGFNDVVSFEVFPTAVLGSNFTQLKVKGLIDAQTAEANGFQPYVIHKQVYTFIPKGNIPYNASDYQYVLLEYPDGQKTAIGLPWIDMNTVKVHRENRAIITLQNVAQEKIQLIQEFLSANDITIVDITMKDI